MSVSTVDDHMEWQQVMARRRQHTRDEDSVFMAHLDRHAPPSENNGESAARDAYWHGGLHMIFHTALNKEHERFHTLFWTIMSMDGDDEAIEALRDMVNRWLLEWGLTMEGVDKAVGLTAVRNISLLTLLVFTQPIERKRALCAMCIRAQWLEGVQTVVDYAAKEGLLNVVDPLLQNKTMLMVALEKRISGFAHVYYLNA